MFEAGLQFLVNGLVTGCFYALIALGLTLIFGMMGVVNFAHGEFFVLGGVFAYWFVALMGLPFWLAVILVVVVMALLGAAFDVTMVRPLRSAHILSTALVTIRVPSSRTALTPPKTASATDSVPPDVNTISSGCAPIAEATIERESSMSERDLLPASWRLRGSPKISSAPTIAACASAASGVAEAESR